MATLLYGHEGAAPTPASTQARGKAEEQLKGRPGFGELAKATGQASAEQWQLRQ